MLLGHTLRPNDCKLHLGLAFPDHHVHRAGRARYQAALRTPRSPTTSANFVRITQHRERATGPRLSQHHRVYDLRSADAMAMPSFHSSCDLLALALLIQRDRCLPVSRSTRFRKKKKTSSRIRELEAARPSPTKSKADSVHTSAPFGACTDKSRQKSALCVTTSEVLTIVNLHPPTATACSTRTTTKKRLLYTVAQNSGHSMCAPQHHTVYPTLRRHKL